MKGRVLDRKNIKVKTNGNKVLTCFLVVMHQYKFIKYSKCTILIQDVIKRGNWVWGIWEIAIFGTFKNVLEKVKNLSQ